KSVAGPNMDSGTAKFKPTNYLNQTGRVTGKFMSLQVRPATKKEVNEYYVEGRERGAKVQELFARIAPRYDLINDLQCLFLHRYWKGKVLELSHFKAGERALDVCCGTGDLAFGLAQEPGAVVGVDFTREMLMAGVSRRRSGKVQMIQADGLRLPFADGSFDVVTVGYGLRNLASAELGVKEFLRVLAPGGRLVVLEFGKPENRLWRSFYFAYLRVAVPVFGKLFCGDAAAYGYILESLRRYPGQREVDRLIQREGGRESRVHNFFGGAMSINFARK
ncbi:MAG: ubiquinone/menaquinone biosynthesis methyltransferase, partial [Verrucomicrobiota bacterium]|nr:ubiquinone/menaquinone biosynthesis methyltransferase [Verrucomicrobiota bacterium]